MATQRKAGKVAMSMAIAAMTLSSIHPAGAASPDAPREDVFGRTTGTPPAQRTPIRGHVSSTAIHKQPMSVAREPRPKVSEKSNPQEWFDAFDAYWDFYKPTKKDEFTVNSPFNQEAEKVTIFCQTVSRISRNYRILAQKIKTLPSPVEMGEELKEYKSLMANWYEDSALVYEDMVKPRPPARTKEELNSWIKDISDRSESLKQNLGVLHQMDHDMRRKFHVNPPKSDDALYGYTGHH